MKCRLLVRGTKKGLVENSKLKIIAVTGEGPISGTWYQKKLAENCNLKIVR